MAGSPPLLTQLSTPRRPGFHSSIVLIAAALAVGFLTREDPELLVLDEPTNNLDLPNIAFLESVVQSFAGAVLVASHDETFLENCHIDEQLVLGEQAGSGPVVARPALDLRRS